MIFWRWNHTKKGHRGATRHQGMPGWVACPGGLWGPCGSSATPPKLPGSVSFQKKIVKKFRCIWTSFDMDFLENQKQAENNNWHWALGQYVSP